jgi:4-diphosphocytidyl-2-C-methyl-D-erythritol kinase
VVVFPNCKINLGLHIIRKRADGYHDLETVFYPVPLTDALEIITETSAQTGISFSSSGLHIDTAEESNLCMKAYRLLKKDFPRLPPVKMHLHKAIPMGAGLGGGSADAAFTLMLLNNKFNLSLSTNQLINYSLQLGSDCPFFIINKACFATGRGEVLEEISLDLSAYKIAIVNPGIHINTGWAFSQIRPAQPNISIREIMQEPVGMWKDRLVNDFEKPVLAHYPQLQLLKEQLYKLGALYAAMSGSGSTFYGVFDKEIEINKDSFPPQYFVKIAG